MLFKLLITFKNDLLSMLRLPTNLNPRFLWLAKLASIVQSFLRRILRISSLSVAPRGRPIDHEDENLHGCR
jgi:hypothetical protein